MTVCVLSETGPGHFMNTVDPSVIVLNVNNIIFTWILMLKTFIYEGTNRMKS
jgi:hypothetical protein